ncbi:MAG: RidA family protein [Steroidobacteraceae bacterium]
MRGPFIVKGSSGYFLLTAVALAAAAPLALGALGSPERSYVEHSFPPASTAPPFSDAVRSGDTLYVAGHIGIDPQTGNAAADPRAEARLLMDAVQRTVERAGFAMDDFVSITVYCTDLALYDTFNAVYGGYFHGPHPARAFIGVDKLVRGAHYELQGIALKRPRK